MSQGAGLSEPVALPSARRSVCRARRGGSRRSFVSTLTHEVRAPLAAIKSYCEILLACPPEDEAERASFVRTIADESDRLIRLLNDLVDIEKLEAEGTRLVPAPCDMDEIVARAALALHPLAAAKQVDLTVACDGEPAIVWGEPQQLARAVTALLENAVKFSETGGAVAVRLRVLGAENLVAVEVADAGIGVPDGAAEGIFEPFFQADVPPDTVSPRGCGLGLTLARLVAQRHGGLVSYHGKEKGSVFTLSLPSER